MENRSILEAALVGYEVQRAAIVAQIAAIQARLLDDGVVAKRRGGRPVTAPGIFEVPKAKSAGHPMKGKKRSAAVRKRMAAAQRARWAAAAKRA